MMGTLLGFVSPWLLLGLLALPVLWFLLRAAPPAPVRRRFPGVILLLGLTDEPTASRTPWWLLALRMAALAAAIIGFAGPVLNPVQTAATDRPILILADASWAAARDWPRTQARLRAELDRARAAGRPVAIAALSRPTPAPLQFTTALAALAAIPELTPRPWDAQPFDIANLPQGNFDTLWLSDGLDRADRAPLLAALQTRGAVTVAQHPIVAALGPARVEDGALMVPVLGPQAGFAVDVTAIGPDPNGVERDLATVQAKAGAAARFDLPPELRNRVARFEIIGQGHAGAVSLTDDATKRRKVALVDGGAAREGLELLSPTHYLRQALAMSADLIEGGIDDVLLASPDVIILADLADMPETDRLADWVDRGGLLLRFAGPRLAASANTVDPLLPVALRAGGRSVGGTMSWGAPRKLAPFPEGSPFLGLAVPDEVTVRGQVIAEPSPELSERVIAALEDGTPLVTRARLGDGQIVLFHVTANAEWSSLPLSGLFVSMLDRLAVAARAGDVTAEDLAGGPWVARKLLDAQGRLQDAATPASGPATIIAPDAAGIDGADLAAALAAQTRAPDPAPGLYATGDRQIALNVMSADRVLAPAIWPATVTLEGAELARQMPLKGALIAAALILALLDILASLKVGGRLARAAVFVIALPLAMALAPPARAQTDPARAVEAAGSVVLAYVETGNPDLDATSNAGLTGLSQLLAARTTVEPGAPMAVNLENDDLALFSILYWPISADQPAPSAAAYLRLNRYLRAGGMIVFDTRDADIAGFGTATPEGKRLQALAAPLDIPPLEPIPTDHVLTRSFYLLQDFPGRFAGTQVWVEAATDTATDTGDDSAKDPAVAMPFRQLNDGVTPVVLGGNDWASAWAMDANGAPMFPVGRGMGGERQREIAYRFGINLVMHVLTGNYKSDQVHVPALLERLGQ